MLTRRFLAVFVLAGAGLAAPNPVLAAKDYRAVHYDVKLAVEPGGSMLVTETIRFAFGDDTFSYVSRELPARRIDGLTVLAARMDGRTLTRGDGPGQYEVRRQDQGGRRVRWHFAKLTASEHTFTLVYRVAGVVRHAADSDLLEWRALPTEHEYSIGCATLELTYPASAVLAGAPAVTPAPVREWPGSGPVAFERCGFGRNDSWQVRVAFAPRTVVEARPDWQRRGLQAQQKRPVLIGLALMIFTGGVVAFVVFGLNQRPAVSRGRHAVTGPPDALPLILGAALAEDGRATWKPVLGTIFDLARRGVVTITELPAARLTPRDFLIADEGGSSELHPTERAVCHALFESGDRRRSALKVSELAGVRGSTSRWRRIVEAVREGLAAEGLIDAERSRTRSRGMAVAVIVAAMGVVGLVAAIPLVREFGGATLLPGAALGLAGLVGLAIAHGVTPLTDEAQGRSARWHAYGRHLKTLSRATHAPAAQSGFDRLLPAAVAFGVGREWAKALHKQGITSGLSWLHTQAADGSEPDHMRAVLAMLSAGDAAAGSPGGHAGSGTAAVAGGGSSSAG